jgi:hypothetical protein
LCRAGVGAVVPLCTVVPDAGAVVVTAVCAATLRAHNRSRTVETYLVAFILILRGPP